MRLGEGVRHDPRRVADAELEGVRAGPGERAVVVTAAAAEPAAPWVEGESGAEEEIDFRDPDLRQAWLRFENPVGAGNEVARGIGHRMENQLLARHPRQQPAAVGQGGEQWQQVDLARQRGEGGQRPQPWPKGKPAGERLARHQVRGGWWPGQGAHALAQAAFGFPCLGCAHAASIQARARLALNPPVSMPVEIERKFLVRDDSWRDGPPGERIAQGYLSRDPERTVRVRLAGERAWLTVKGLPSGLARPEFEYPVPPAHARELLALCLPGIVEKTRHRRVFGGFVWEIDEFYGDNRGLVLAEIELPAAATRFERPPWLGREVSEDPRFANSRLAAEPWGSGCGDA